MFVIYQELENFRIFYFGPEFGSFLNFWELEMKIVTIFCSQIHRTAGAALLYQWIIHFSLILKFLINNYFLLIVRGIASGCASQNTLASLTTQAK